MAITLDGSNGITTDIASNESATFNRDTTDGDLIILQKDNSTVGSIGADSGDLVVHSSTSGHNGLRFHLNGIYPTDNAGGLVDADANLGSSSARFKDLYLSGGAYIGGTTSANYLDDYEEGVWTPVVNTASGFTSGITAWWGNQPTYTKIGNVVFLRAGFYFQNSSGNVSTSDYVRIDSGLPFTPVSQVVASGAYYAFNTSNNAHATCYMDGGGLPIIAIHTVYGAPNRSGGAFGLTLTYYTNS